MPNTIEIKLDRKDVSADDFAEAIMATIRLVTSVLAQRGVPVDEIRWVISDLRFGSAYVSADPHILGKHAYMADIDAGVAAVARGIQDVTKGAPRPSDFTEEALKTSRRLMQIAQEFDAGTAMLGFGNTKLRPSEEYTSRVETILRADVPSIGSIEGTLVGVSVGDGTYRIFVHDRLRNRRTPCVIASDLLSSALAAFEKRVIVRGIISTKPDGTATRINVRRFEVIPPDDELPSRHEVRGIMAGYERVDDD